MLGYFSLIGLLRVHTLIGDYHSALKGANGCRKVKGVCTKACAGLDEAGAQLAV
jgi:hypothetical protein